MKPENHPHLIYRIIKYGIEKGQFTLRQLYSDLKITPEERAYTNFTINPGGSTDNPNHIIIFLSREGNGLEDYTCAILPTAVMSYTDYLEIQEARKNSEFAKRQSFWALTISIIALVVSGLIGIVQIWLQLKQNS